MLNGVDLFSGIGGIALALGPWVRTVAYCEQDPYCQSVLLSRMQEHRLDWAPIHTDVRELRGDDFSIPCDIITGGFPCQDISIAGHGIGLGGSRSGLFFEIARLARELRPRFIFLENVPALTLRGLPDVCLAITALGYDCRWTIVSAAEIGAPHLRERWFMLAHAKHHRRGHVEQWNSGRCNAVQNQRAPEPGLHGKARSLAHPDGLRQLQSQRGEQSEWGRFGNMGQEMANAFGERGGEGRTWAEVWGRADDVECDGVRDESGWWAIEPNVGRVAHGVQSRVDRIKCLGNSVVPAQAREAFKRLMGLGNDHNWGRAGGTS